jgi:hypothetical protein
MSLAMDGDLNATSTDAKHCSDLLIGAPGVLRESTAASTTTAGAFYVLYGITY